MTVTMDNILCTHYLLKNKEILKFQDFLTFFNNIKNTNYIIKNHIYLRIEDTIHYNLLKNSKYEKLYEQYINLTYQPEHNLEIYKNLINNFDLSKINKIKVKKMIINDTLYYVVQDGVHRLSILKHMQIKNIEDYITIMN